MDVLYSIAKLLVAIIQVNKEEKGRKNKKGKRAKKKSGCFPKWT